MDEKIIGSYKHGFVENNYLNSKIKIHYIEKNWETDKGLSLILSPGLWEPAERAIPLFEALDCRCISFSYRGRGKSDTPENGYDLEPHVSDFESVVNHLGLRSFIITAFSRGVGYACGYISKFPEKIKGLIIVDHAPIHVKPNQGYAEYWKNLVYLGKPLTSFMRPAALNGLEQEAREVIFWDMLAKLNIPVTVLRGTSKIAKIPSDLSDEDMSNYRKYLKKFKEINFEHSGHMIVDEELGKYRSVVDEFIKSVDRMNNG